MSGAELSDDNLDLLAAYALDILDNEELLRAQALLREHPELHSMVAELRAAADTLPLALPEAEPDPALRDRVLAHAVGRAPQVTAGTGAKFTQTLRRWQLGLGSLAAAALIAAVLAWGQLAAVQRELDSARVELSTTRNVLDTERARNAEVSAILANGRPIARLEGPGGSGSVVAADDGRMLVTTRLPALAQGRVYQLWLIEGNNAPVGAGTFTVDESGTGQIILASANAGSTFAVTDEPQGGSPAPTTPVLVAGAGTAS
ncbi:MAG TPA: anti-sigma factor [Roseiflexaceae bacterium]|nr:anti-sigma factor [Roseiflexaceae bacterium]